MSLLDVLRKTSRKRTDVQLVGEKLKNLTEIAPGNILIRKIGAMENRQWQPQPDPESPIFFFADSG